MAKMLPSAAATSKTLGSMLRLRRRLFIVKYIESIDDAQFEFYRKALPALKFP